MPESILSKNDNSINYHTIQETIAVAAGIMQAAKEHTQMKLTDVLTKLLPYARKHELLQFIYLGLLVGCTGTI